MAANKDTCPNKGSRGTVVRVDATGGSTVILEENEAISQANAEVFGVDCISEDEIISKAQNADVIMTGAAMMTRRVMEGLPRCKAVIRYGSSVGGFTIHEA